MRVGLVAGVVGAWAVLVAPAPAATVPPPDQDPFYVYDGARPLAQVPPGTVLKSRTVPAHVAGVPTAITAVQLLYRTTGQRGRPTVNVTSVLRPPKRHGRPKLISYQSFYDSLNRDDQPSYAVAGGVTLGGLIVFFESSVVAPFLEAGYTVSVPDVEGQGAHFAAGREYGMNTLDALRATFRSPAARLPPSTRAGLIGYSGGAIATEWAAELASAYAPDVDRRIVGAAMGGVLVHPAHNLRYVDGSSLWAGVMPMALVGTSRAFGVSITPYLSSYGLQVYERLRHASIVEVLGSYPGLTWAQLVKPQYRRPESVPPYVQVVNQLIMGSRDTPTVPLFIGQGARGELEGTPGDKPGIGPGDGVMVAGDVRSLAREYCGRGVPVQYDQYDNLSHITAAAAWLPAAASWLSDRFAGRPAPQNCAQIAPGNSLAPISEPPS